MTRLDQADAVIREAIAWVAQVDADSFDISVVPVIPQAVDEHISAARAAREDEAAARRRAALEWRAAATELGELGLPQRDVGTILGISAQRVQQLTASQ